MKEPCFCVSVSGVGGPVRFAAHGRTGSTDTHRYLERVEARVKLDLEHLSLGRRSVAGVLEPMFSASQRWQQRFHPRKLAACGSVAGYVGEDFLFVVYVVVAADIDNDALDSAADEGERGGVVGGDGGAAVAPDAQTVTAQ